MRNQRRERDSNPRYVLVVQRISNLSLSTTQPSLLKDAFTEP
jgi:hypothetical protein